MDVLSLFQLLGTDTPALQGGFFLWVKEPVEVLEGGPEDWSKLEERLEAYREKKESDPLHPPGAAVGQFSYEGNFRFAFHERVEVIAAGSLSLPTLRLPGALGGITDPSSGWSASCTQQEYEGMVREAQEAIRRGDVYQVNLAQRFHREVTSWDASRFFQALWQLTAAPYSALLRWPDRDLVAASPELFLSIQGRRVTTQPIKGTRPRSRQAMDDRRNALELSTDPKEVAELVMITDLERNDLGTFCEYGSVEVKELVRCRTYSHVFHLVSTIVGRMREGCRPLQAVRHCFPGGSITGAPKRTAMELIRRLEGRERGSYTGAFGYFGFDGSMQLGMAIRTCEQVRGCLSFWAGSGITMDSNPGREWQETHHKARAMQEAYALYERTREQDGETAAGVVRRES
ncbi:MAG: anthranilate synthase component I family protein [Blastochloris sp.]|nr:anthranilate synthase component I family protein [Blastochloris sp.]